MQGAFAGNTRHHLLQERLGFQTFQQLNAFIDSDAVQSSFEEFVAAFLHPQRSAASAPNFNEVMESIGKEQLRNTDIYKTSAPDKNDWTAVEHAARFIVQTQTKASEDVDCEWPGLEEEDQVVWGWQLFELLSYLTLLWLNANAAQDQE
jgi:hypothetical protein